RGVHGGCRLTCAWRCDRHDSRHHQARAASHFHWRRVRGGSCVGDGSGLRIQVFQQEACLPNGSATPSFRIGWMVRIESHHSVLDCGTDSGSVQSLDVEAQVMAKKLQPDRVLFLVTLLLVGLGVAMVFSSSAIVAKEKFGDPNYFSFKQL